MSEHLDQFLEAMASADPEAVAAFYADDCRLQISGGSEFVGAAAVREYMSGLNSALTGTTHALGAVVVDGDTVAVEVTSTAVHSAPLSLPGMGELPATGRTVTTSGVALFWFEDGKIARFKMYFDRLAIVEQLGLLPTS